eukprot:SAG31_NODE_4463_length_3213_cov_2.754978_3_plen_104_part_00
MLIITPPEAHVPAESATVTAVPILPNIATPLLNHGQEGLASWHTAVRSGDGMIICPPASCHTSTLCIPPLGMLRMCARQRLALARAKVPVREATAIQSSHCYD